MPDGSTITIEKDGRSEDNILMYRESDVRLYCNMLFKNLGWEVKTDQIVSFEDGEFKSDIELSNNEKVVGYVEVISSLEREELERKREIIRTITEKIKPDIFILTNGYAFDLYRSGEYVRELTFPPSPSTYNRLSRLYAYYKKIQDIKGKTK